MLKSIWVSRNLVSELVRRDLKIRYLGSLLGGVWSILNPLLQLTVYTVVFSVFLGQHFRQGSSSGQFALFLFAALLPWLSFQETLNRSSRTFIDHSQLIKKTRFSLPTLPLSLTISTFLHQCVGTLLLFVVLIFTGEIDFSTVWIWPLVGFLQMILVFGLALMLACATVLIRDISQALGVVLLVLFWMTPIVYSRDRAGELDWILGLNPLTHLIELHRFALFGQPVPSSEGLLYLLLVSFSALVLGAIVHFLTRKLIVDLV